jgi:hypothetical protein
MFPLLQESEVINYSTALLSKIVFFDFNTTSVRLYSRTFFHAMCTISALLIYGNDRPEGNMDIINLFLKSQEIFSIEGKCLPVESGVELSDIS